jgi:putative ABC transport system permease protein
MWHTIHTNNRQPVYGDFEEEFNRIAAEHGLFYARWWYRMHVCLSLPAAIANSIIWSFVMLKSYFIITLRLIKRYKLNSMINVFGLAVGMACSIIVFLFVQDELSYNMFHKKADQIYRVWSTIKLPSKTSSWASAPRKFGEYATADFPEVLDAVRTGDYGFKLLRINNKLYNEDVMFAEQNFFDVFTFPFVKGDSKTALKEPDTAVITKSFADKYFGDEDPIGQVINLDSKVDVTITGIIEDVPENSDFKFDIAFSFTTLRRYWGPGIYDYGGFESTTYLVLDKSASPERLMEKFPDFTLQHFGKRRAERSQYFIHSLPEMHFFSEFNPFSNAAYSYSLSAAAAIILLIACINFINLSTARAVRRSKEVGLRKVIGANRPQLARQFLGEAMFLSGFALIISLVFAAGMLATFNQLSGKNLSLGLLSNFNLYIGLACIALFTGLFAGIYPALFLSSFRPSDVLKNRSGGRSFFSQFSRKGLVIIQFAFSIIFIIGTILVYSQLNFIKNKDLGFEQDNILTISLMEDISVGYRYDVIKSELLSYPNIQSITAAGSIPGLDYWYPQNFVPEEFPKDEPVKLSVYYVSEGFFDFYGIDLVEGRDFSRDFSSDSLSGIILSETAAKLIGWESSVGKQIKIDSETKRYDNKGLSSIGYDVDKMGTVVGVVKDFHSESLKEEIKPVMFRYRPDMYNYLSLKISDEDIQGTIAFLQDKWKDYSPNVIFDYYFVDDKIAAEYLEEEKTGNIIMSTSIIAVILACLGLFGLSSYTAERRTKEIGIRKVMGADIKDTVVMLSKEFAILVLAANIIAWPVAYYGINRWLENFAYRITPGIGLFILAGVIALMIAVFTVSYHALKAARANPVDSLRYE